MEQVLSQNEVNALLEAVGDGSITAGEDALQDQNFERYDLASQDRIIRGHMPGMDIINDRLNRNLQIALSTLLRRVVDVQPEFSGLMKFGEFINQLIAPTSLNLFRMSPLRGTALVAIETRFVFSMLNSFFGGSRDLDSDIENLEGHDFTLIEANIVQKIIKTILYEIKTAWSPVHEVDTVFVRTETNPQFVGVVPHSDAVINTQYTIEFDGAVGVLNIVIPYSMIEPIKQKLSISTSADEQELDMHWIRRLKTEMMRASVKLRVELGRASLTIREMQQLKVGDVIMLDNDATNPLTLLIENVEKMRGKPVVHKGHIALKVTDPDIQK